MPLVFVHLAEGPTTTPDKKKKLVEGITTAFANIGVSAEKFHILINVHPKENWARGGKFLSEG